MNIRTFIFYFALTLIASAEPFQTAEMRLRAELKEIEQVRQTLKQREQEIAIRIKDIRAGRDTTAGISNICPVHKTKMGKVKVPIAFGVAMIKPTDPSPDLRKREFPFARRHWEGGCVLGDYTEAQIFVCPKCRQA